MSTVKKESADLRDFLALLHAQKKEKNAKFSLRAWAKQLGVSPATLSKLIRKEMPLSEKTFLEICRNLKLKNSEIRFYSPSVKRARKKLPKESLDDRESNASVLSHWLVPVLLENLALSEPLSVPEVARHLGISEADVQRTLEALLSSGMIHYDQEGQIKLTKANRSTVKAKKITVDLSARQIATLQKAIQSIQTKPESVRDQSTITLAIDPALMSIAKEKIKEFRRELATFLEENSESKTAIYEMSVSLFPVLSKH